MQTREDFARVVVTSGLLSAEELQTFWDQLPEDQRPNEASAYANLLVQKSLLTEYQKSELLAGRDKNLVLGNYVILAKLGQGGMGMVLKAIHRRMERVVAIKVMSPEGMKSPDAVQRFHREVKAAAKLSHPNIVAAHDADEAKGTHFLVMEYVEGTDLSILVKKNGPFPVDQAIRCIIQAARGLEFAHKRGVIHRDIKPANLLLDNEGTVKILDMGLARIDGSVGGSSEGAGLTSTGMIMGTVDYMSPEQAMDTKVADARSDVYSLGCSLYYLLTGRCLYDGDTVMKKLMAHQNAAIPPLTKVSQKALRNGDTASDVDAGRKPDLDASGESFPALEAVFHRMVAKRPGDRPQSMTEVIAELERCLTSGSTQISSGSRATSGSSVTLPRIPRDTPGSSTDIGSPTVVSPRAGFDDASAVSETMISSVGEVSNDPQTGQTSIATRGPVASTGAAKKSQTKLFASIVVAVVVVIAVGLALRGKSPSGVGDKGGSSNGAAATSSQTGETAGTTGFALEFDGVDDRVEIPEWSEQVSELTIECLVKCVSGTNPSPLAFGGNSFTPGGDGWAFTIDGSGVAVLTGPAKVIDPDHWVHLAGVSTGKEYRFYINGRQVAVQAGPVTFDGHNFIGCRTLNAMRRGSMEKFFGGQICRVRLSKVARYQENFNPPTPSTPFVTDPDTLALYNFGDGNGDVLKDSSGNNHHGKIVGAKWKPMVPSQGTSPTDTGKPSLTPYEILTSPDYEWTPPENIGPGVNTAVADKHSALSGDGLRLIFFSHGRADTGLSEATRASTDEPFGVAQPLGEEFRNWSVDFGTALSGDGLVLVFGSKRAGGPGEPGNVNLWQATRPDLTTPFSKLVCLKTLNSEGDDVNPWLSADGLTIVFQSLRPAGVYWMSRRASRDAEFEEATPFELPLIPGVARYGHSGQALSSDERVMIFAPAYHHPVLDRHVERLMMSVRPSRDAKFGTPVDLGDVVNGEFGGLEPTLSADGTVLVFHSVRPGCIGVHPDSDLWMTRRVRKRGAGQGSPDEMQKPRITRFPVEQAKQYQQAWAKHLGVPVEKEVTLPGGEKLELVFIPPGEFIRSEGGQFVVRLTKPFYLGKFEVTQAQWQSVMGNNPSQFASNPTHPVEMVNCYDIDAFLTKLNNNQTPSKVKYSLPTDAQSEYAFRAGSWTNYWFGNSVEELQKHDWFVDNSGGKTHPVGQLKPNPFGLFDVHGNVVEFCADWHELGYFAQAPVEDPLGPQTGANRVARSAGWEAGAVHCQSGARHAFPATSRVGFIGFRLAATVEASGIQTSTATTHTRDLIAGFDPERGVAPWRANGASNRWTRKGSTLQFDADGQPGLVRFPVSDLLDANYRLVIEFTRTAGTNGFNIDLPLSSGFFTINLDEGDRHRTGLSKSGQYTDEFRIEPNRRHRLEFTFDGRSPQDLAELKIDGRSWLTWRGDRQQVAIAHRDPKAADTKWPGFWIPAKGSSWTFHRIEVTSLPTLATSDNKKTSGITAPGVAPKPAIAPFDAQQARAHQEAWAKHLGTTVETTNSVGAKMILIPPGEFLMGSTDEQVEAVRKLANELDDHGILRKIEQTERPQHKVLITKPFLMNATEVTIGQFKKFVEATKYVTEGEQYGFGDSADKVLTDKISEAQKQHQWRSPGYAVTDDFPVAYLTWNDAVAYCRWLSDQEQTTYRLPTEAEWEYACRAGTMTPYSFGDDVALLDQNCWYIKNSQGRPHPVEKKLPNGFGLFDMYGNLQEWCGDFYEDKWYEKNLPNDPTGPSAASYHVVRGGLCVNSAVRCRSAYRNQASPSLRDVNLGFRCVRELNVPAKTASVTPPVAQAVGPQPPPAKAPFDAKQARSHQEAWAKHLGVPVEYTNSLGMKFSLIPPGEFLMGSTPEEIGEVLKQIDPNDKPWVERINSESPRHKVILTQPFYLGVNEITQAEYEKVMSVNPSHFASTGMGKAAVAGIQTANHPVENVNWNDAAEFCIKLSQQEKLKPFYLRDQETITPMDGTGYRLPSEAEWEFACRAGTGTKFWIGDKDEDFVRAGWFAGNSTGRTHAVGELLPNSFGLHDVHGNVWEWIQDGHDVAWYLQFREKSATNPNSPFRADSPRVVRGGDWFHPLFACRSAYRHAADPKHRDDHLGFRVSLSIDAVKEQLAQKAAATPKPAIAPFDAQQARAHQEAWAKHLDVPVEYTNNIGMKFVLIPPGEFMMGSTQKDIDAMLVTAANDTDWQNYIRVEGPQHRVVLTNPFYLGMHEVTQSQYQQVMGANPSHFSLTGAGKATMVSVDSGTHPVEMVTWNDSLAFCSKLNSENGSGYRLPTEAEWEYACRAGTLTKFWTGDESSSVMQSAWSRTNSGGRTHAIGEGKPNAFGLFDIHGNVWEWVQDRFEPEYFGMFKVQSAIDPVNESSTSRVRLFRGGSWAVHTLRCRAADRGPNLPTFSGNSIGFRTAVSVDAVRQALKRPAKVTPQTAVAPFDAKLARAHQEAWAKHLGVPVEYTNGIGMKFRLIPPGEFLMGSGNEHVQQGLDWINQARLSADAFERSRIQEEGPQHSVKISKPFCLGEVEVTVGQFRAFVDATKYLTQGERFGGGNSNTWSPNPNVKPEQVTVHWRAPGYPTSDNHPVTQVTWADCIAFCNWLSEREGLSSCYSGNEKDGWTYIPGSSGYRLPTEAEWEYSCRAGTTTHFSFGDDPLKLAEYGWFARASTGKPQAGSQKLPNPFGLFDLHGNIREWCYDWYSSEYYASSPAVDPAGPESGSDRVMRGGRIGDKAIGCRSAFRYDIAPFLRNAEGGFRVVRSIPPTITDLLLASDAAWSEPETPGLELNSSREDVSPFLSEDGLSLLFASKRPFGHVGFEIWESHRSSLNEPFGPPKELPRIVNSIGDDDSPWLSVDGRELFFASNRPGSNGHRDLYVCRRSTPAAKWEAPVNLGAVINTADNEDCPVLADNGLTLYFSSNRPGGKGGMDVWRAIRPAIDAPFEAPVNLGPIVNSSRDDLNFAPLRDGRSAVLSQQDSSQSTVMIVRMNSQDRSFGPLQTLDLGKLNGSVRGVRLSQDGASLYFHASQPKGAGAFDVWRIRRAQKASSAGDTRATNSLHFDGNGARVEIPSLVMETSKPITIEAWTLPSKPSTHGVVAGFAGQCVLRLRDRQWWFGVRDKNSTIHEVVASSDADLKRPTHVAGVYDGSQMRLFVNGIRQGEPVPCPSVVAVNWMATMGATFDGKDPYAGAISLARFSRIARYADNFTPPASFDFDDSTLALYRFTEGQGTVLTDETASKHHGKIVNAKWSLSPQNPQTRSNAAELSPDRRAAEWVIGVGGEVYVDGFEKPIKDVKALPSDGLKLTQLQLAGRTLSGEDVNLIPLQGLQHLTFAGLDGTRVSVEGLAVLEQLPNLSQLSLGTGSGFTITDAHLDALVRIRKLKNLYLVGSSLTRSHCEKISQNLTELGSLNLQGNVAIDDTAVIPLGKLSRLRNLQLQRTKVTGSGIEALKKVLPDCMIEWDQPDSSK
ncbi:MAG: SUMF1/EgtB/PvdO family nonheme iron enzyme [Planctomycetaceae bacterium]